VEDTLPCWPCLLLLAESVNDLPVDLTTSIVEINIGKSDGPLALPDPTCDPEHKNYRDGEPRLEKLFGSGNTTSWWCNGRE